jgi:glyoxylase-like metal-dependent hydrolase (beta-lactamase superfamily II)
MLHGAGGNIGLSVGDDAVFVIDDQFAPLTPKIQAAIAKLTSKPVKFVLNTHWHFDHTGGNENLGNAGDYGNLKR